MVSDRVHEVTRVGSDLAVLVEGQPNDLPTCWLGTLTDERDPAFRAVPDSGFSDPFVRLTEQGVVPPDSLRGCWFELLRVLLSHRPGSFPRAQAQNAHARQRRRALRVPLGESRVSFVDGRETRKAKNEATFRATNREIERVAQSLGEHAEDTIDVICECGQPACEVLLKLTIREYDEIHRQRDRFVVAPGHIDANMERVVRSGNGFAVVDKFGEAEAVAEAEERRAGTN